MPWVSLWPSGGLPGAHAARFEEDVNQVGFAPVVSSSVSGSNWVMFPRLHGKVRRRIPWP